MAIYEVAITDVTRYGTLYCVAGWDLRTGRMVRPEPPGANINNEASRFWGAQDAGPGKFFAVGNVVRFDADGPPAHFPFPHATEDKIFITGPNSAVVQQLAPSKLVQAVATGVSPSFAQAFGGRLTRASSGKAYVSAGVQTKSLDAIDIAPVSITFYEDSPAPGKRRVRAWLNDNGIRYDLSVPADSSISRFQGGGIAGLKADAKASSRIHVRLGLCRPFAAMPNSCYAQINGLFFL